MQKNHKIELVLFDLDGTLIDTAPDFILSLNNVLKKHNKEQLDGNYIRSHVSDGSAKLTEIGFKLSIDDPKFLNHRNELLDEYKKNLTNKSNLFEGVFELIESLNSKNIPFGIVTNKPLKYAKPVVEHFKILNNSKVLICPDHLSAVKPNPEGILLACSKLNINPINCIYIGDHPKDIEAGKNAGTKTIGCEYGYSLLKKSDYDETPIVKNAIEIIPLIN